MKQGNKETESGRSDGQSLWELVRSRGMDRRQFLRLMVAGGAAAVLANCIETEPSTGLPPQRQAGTDSVSDSPWFKDPGPFIKHEDKSLEARLENMQGLITPNRFFFVRNNSESLAINSSAWRLHVNGDAVTQPVELTYGDVRRLPSRAITSYLECAGNHRAMFDVVRGRKASGTQWKTGGIGNGEWVGAALSDVLTLAGIRPDAVSVLLVGLDAGSPEEGFRYVLPADKAMHPDTLLAYALNGETLPKDHGYPLRALVPGWVGSANIKWLGQIVVSDKHIWTRNNTSSYVLVGDHYSPQGESLGKPVTEQVIKSALALPWPAELSAGSHRIHGYAHSPAGRISQVEWSTNSGRTWSKAGLSGRQHDHSWERFEFVWSAERGEQTIMTRATDVVGNTQPNKVPYNEKGYLFNEPVPHPINVT